MLENVVRYLLRHYPADRREDLSISRLTLLLYLTDWRAAVVGLPPFSQVKWQLSECGPDPAPIVDFLAQRPDSLEVVAIDGKPYRHLVRLTPSAAAPPIGLAKEQIAVLDHVLAETADADWDVLRKLVNSTFPVFTQPTGWLDLAELASTYRADWLADAPA